MLSSDVLDVPYWSVLCNRSRVLLKGKRRGSRNFLKRSTKARVWRMWPRWKSARSILIANSRISSSRQHRRLPSFSPSRMPKYWRWWVAHWIPIQDLDYLDTQFLIVRDYPIVFKFRLMITSQMLSMFTSSEINCNLWDRLRVYLHKSDKKYGLKNGREGFGKPRPLEVYIYR